MVRAATFLKFNTEFLKRCTQQFRTNIFPAVTRTYSASSKEKDPILEKLKSGETIIGDGGMTYALERRGFVTVTNWTPEAVVEHPEAVRQLHREFALCGADVLQAFVFNGTDDRLNRHREGKEKLNCEEVNDAGCRLVTEVAKEFGCYTAFPISTTTAYEMKLGKDAVQEEFRRQVAAFEKFQCDLFIGEYIGTVEEAEWAVEVIKEKGLPVAITLSISPLGDMNGVPAEECGIRLARAGVDIIGTNCRFSPDTSLEAAIMMKNGIESKGMSAIYMCQPNGYHIECKDVLGLSEVPECPFALETKTITRFEAQKFARNAYDAGFRYIGGCCGFESYHIRALAEELHMERQKLPINSRGVNANALSYHELPSMRAKANKEFWYNLSSKKL